MSDNGAFEIDGIELWPQPDKHDWARRIGQIVGYDGEGAPIPLKYRPLRLIGDRDTNGQYNWDDFDDLTTHALTAPAPNSVSGWTDYTGCYCVVSHGGVDDARSMEGVVMDIKRAVA